MEVSGQLDILAALPREDSPATDWGGGPMGPRTGLGMVAERKSSAQAGNRIIVTA
jgi:hypothetical protein